MIKKLRKNKFILIPLLILSVVLITTLGRFVYIEIRKNFVNSENFYFESDKLRENNAVYQVNNYNGVDNYDIVINMNSIKNNKLRATTDISYDISYTCSAKANCSVSKTTGTIYEATGTDFFIVSLSPSTSLSNGDSIGVDIEVESTSPYEKGLSATFTLVVGNYGLSYEIYDEVGRPYIEFKMTNTLDYYTVKEAFSTYQVNDLIDIETYLSLSDTDKNKCASAIINLDFDPNVIIFDNASIVKGLISTSTTLIGGYNYIDELSFKIDAISSVIVRFYKKNRNLDYTYPIVNQYPILNVTYS